MFDEDHSVRIFHIGYFRKKQEKLKILFISFFDIFLNQQHFPYGQSLDSLLVVKKFIYSNFGSKVKSPV